MQDEKKKDDQKNIFKQGTGKKDDQKKEDVLEVNVVDEDKVTKDQKTIVVGKDDLKDDKETKEGEKEKEKVGRKKGDEDWAQKILDDIEEGKKKQAEKVKTVEPTKTTGPGSGETKVTVKPTETRTGRGTDGTTPPPPPAPAKTSPLVKGIITILVILLMAAGIWIIYDKIIKKPAPPVATQTTDTEKQIKTDEGAGAGSSTESNKGTQVKGDELSKQIDKKQAENEQALKNAGL